MTKPYTIEAMELGQMENFIYLICDHATNTAAAVDPAWEVSKIVERAKELGVTITDILLTHSHFDHVNGVDALLKTFDAQIHLLKAEADFWGKYKDNAVIHHGGDVIKIGKTEIKLLHTPGHTPGSVCFHCGNDLITGDTMFVFGCGRCDLAGGDPNQMFDTLRKLKTELPANTIIHPGHNYAEKETSTMGEQADGNPFMHFEKREDFVRYRMVEHDKIRNSPYRAVPRAKM